MPLTVTKVSVVVPCYNVAPYLERCLESLINQTLAEIEILCIDDKSTDNTLTILREYEQKDNRIRVFALEKNSGVSVARNTGVEHATGEYIGFVDPDDYVGCDFYEKLYQVAHEENKEVVKGICCINNQNKDFVLNREIKQNIANFHWQFWSAIYKRDFLEQHNVRFPVDVITGQDTVFLSQIVLRKPSVAVINNAIYCYIRRDDSLDSSVLSHEKTLSRYKMLVHKISDMKSVNLNKADLDLFMKIHVLKHLKRVLQCYQLEVPADRNMFLQLMHEIYQEYGLVKEFKDVFGRKIVFCLKSKDFMAKCDAYISCQKQKIYFLCFLPFILVEKSKNLLMAKLFFVLPLITIKEYRQNSKKCYLFGFIPLLKIKDKS